MSKAVEANRRVRTSDITLGVLAGGRATRLQGRDKAWLTKDGIPLVAKHVEAFASNVERVLISANRNQSRYAHYGWGVVGDAHAACGPIAGLHALANEARTRWLFTLPVDALELPEDLIARFRCAPGAADRGAYLRDADGDQPLIALWRVDALRSAAAHAISSRTYAIHRLQAALNMTCIPMPDSRIANLNTPHDLRAAGIASP